jgi:L-threonylcarbamoyladenylate synthase
MHGLGKPRLMVFLSSEIRPTMNDVECAAERLRRGELVAFPTETVYGLGANALIDSAVQSIFAAKGRPSDNPLIIHVASLDVAKPLVSFVPSIVERLASRFWPGPLSIVLKISETSGLSKLATAGLDSVGIRVPDHPLALAILRSALVPVAAPSANKSGSPSPTTAAHVIKDFPEVYVVDGGACKVGLESTVIKISDEGRVRILRPGGVTKEQLEEVAGVGEVEDGFSSRPLAIGVAPEAPGMKYRHYAPQATVKPFESEAELKTLLNKSAGDIVLIAFDDISCLDTRAVQRISLGNIDHLEEASRRLFASLRACDDLHASVAIIDARFNRSTGAGVALWNRISKAACSKIDKL